MAVEKKDSEKIIQDLQKHIEKLTQELFKLKQNYQNKKELIKNFNEFLFALGSLFIIDSDDEYFLNHFLDEVWKFMKISEQEDELPE